MHKSKSDVLGEIQSSISSEESLDIIAREAQSPGFDEKFIASRMYSLGLSMCVYLLWYDYLTLATYFVRVV